MKMKARIGAMLAAAVMSFSLAVPALAAVPSADTEATITVQNVKNEGVTVKAYQVVEGTYNSYGLTGYKAIAGVSIADIENPTAAEITKIAADIAAGTITPSPIDLSSTDGSTYTADVPAGSYVVLITGGTDTIYNPILMGVYYTDAQDDTKIAAGTVDAEGNFVYKAENGDGDLEDVTAYVKSDLIPGDKTVTDEDAETDHGSDYAIGDTVPFKIETAFPSYADNYEDVVFNVTDTFSAGLTNNEDVKITITDADDNEVNATEDDYTINYGTDPTIKIEFDSDFVLANGGANVVITYSAEVNDDAVVNLDPNTNSFVIEFTNGPDDTSDGIEGKTYQYTFAIDGKIMGTNEEVEKELVKVSLDENGDPVYEETEGETTTNYYPLAGATFKLTNDDTDAIYYATTDNKGLFGPATVDGTDYAGFVGLDAGEYTLIETVAPTGYTVDGQEHAVKIEAEYYEADELDDDGAIVAHKGQLKSYTITIDSKEQTYTAAYEGGSVTSYTEEDEEGFAVIKNTKLSELPSTGGIGSYVFTIVGVVVMAGAAGIFFMNRRKDEQK